MTYGPIEDFGSFSVLNPIDFYYLGQPYPNNVGLEELERNNFSVSQNYPNPTDALTKIAIEAAAPAQFNLSIVDLTGRLILNEDLGLLNEGRHIHTVDATNFASGGTSTLFNQVITASLKIDRGISENFDPLKTPRPRRGFFMLRFFPFIGEEGL